jgi:ATP-dependent Clp protease ATP-binding subunit ClpC
MAGGRGLEGRVRNMFERFTDRAQRAVVLAQEEAKRLNHNHIGTEHILLGLIHEGEGVAAASLESLGISLEAVRQQVEGIISQGRVAPTGAMPYTPRAKKVLELSLREALQLGHHHIGTEHILLGLIREGRGAAAQVLVRLGADLARVREQVILMLEDAQGEEEPGTRHAGKGSAARKQSGLLAEVLSRVESIDSRLAAVEQRVGAGPDVGDLDQEIARTRSDKKSAAGAEDYEMATALRDRERQLLAEKASRQEQWAAAHLDLPSLAAGLHRLSEEVKRLRGLLRENGIEPQDGAA